MKDWHSREPSTEPYHNSQQSICHDLASSVSALSLARSSPHEEHSSASTRYKINVAIMEEDNNGLKAQTAVLSAKAKSTQLVESKGGVYHRHIYAKQRGEPNQILGSTFNVRICFAMETVVYLISFLMCLFIVDNQWTRTSLQCWKWTEAKRGGQSPYSSYRFPLNYNQWVLLESSSCNCSSSISLDNITS